jgi:hypothetical protein
MPQSTHRKLALCATTGLLVTLTAAGPALAASATDGRDDRRHFRSRVINKSGLLLRSAPSHHAKVVGKLAFGTIARIKCQVNGEWLEGNPRWYLLTNGTWAWASGHYLRNIGPAPFWC